MKFKIIDAPKNGTTGQAVGTFDYADLPSRIQAVVPKNYREYAAQNAAEWTLPALSDGDSGDELSDLEILVQAVNPTWTLDMSDDGGSSDKVEFDTEPIEGEIFEACKDWGNGVAAVSVRWTLTDPDGNESDGWETIDVEAE